MGDGKTKVSSSQHTEAEKPAVRQQGKRKKRRINRLRVFIFLLILLFAAAGFFMLFVIFNMRSKQVSADPDSRKQTVFGVKMITVEGSTHYTDEQLIEASGFYLGQSVFSVNKKKAAENLLIQFPYIAKVTINSPAFDKLNISVEEEQPVGIVQKDDGWIILGKSGKGLEPLSADSDRINGFLKIKCNLVEGSTVGSLLLDSRSLTILNTLLTAFESYGLQNVTKLDISDFSDIRLNWNNQVVMALGNDTNLDHEIGFAVSAFKLVFQKYGDDARGVLDLSFYSDSDPGNDESWFTPEDELTQKQREEFNVFL